MQSRLPQAESRKAKRYRVLKAGRILLAGRYPIDCTVGDLSEAGAKISVEGAPDLPGTLDLLMVLEALVYPCSLAWRKGEFAGLAFVGEPRLLADAVKQKPRGQDWSSDP